MLVDRPKGGSAFVSFSRDFVFATPLVDSLLLLLLLLLVRRERATMPVRIRLSRWGRRNAPFFRVVVADSRSRRDGRNIEQVGWFDPSTGRDGQRSRELKLIRSRVEYWLAVGAQPSSRVAWLLSQAGLLPEQPKRFSVHKAAEAPAAPATAQSPPAPEKDAKDKAAKPAAGLDAPAETKIFVHASSAPRGTLQARAAELTSLLSAFGPVKAFSAGKLRYGLAVFETPEQAQKALAAGSLSLEGDKGQPLALKLLPATTKAPSAAAAPKPPA